MLREKFSVSAAVSSFSFTDFGRAWCVSTFFFTQRKWQTARQLTSGLDCSISLDWCRGAFRMGSLAHAIALIFSVTLEAVGSH
jgi:hypothetical protein